MSSILSIHLGSLKLAELPIKIIYSFWKRPRGGIK